MKISGAKKIHYDSGPNMTPLVDVVMVILIFLMLAGSFGGASHFLISKQGIKASGGHGRPLKPGEIPDVNLEIRVDNSSDGTGFVAQGTGFQPTGSAANLQSELEARRQAMINAGTAAGQIQVVLFPGRSVKYSSLVAIYQAAMRAHFEKIAFATSH